MCTRDVLVIDKDGRDDHAGQGDRRRRGADEEKKREMQEITQPLGRPVAGREMGPSSCRSPPRGYCQGHWVSNRTVLYTFGN